MNMNETARRKPRCDRLRGTEGFTLVELLVSIVVASIVTLAATTVLLLGLRINSQSSRTATRQNTARILMTMLDDLAAEGSIDAVQTEETAGWTIRDTQGNTLLTYSVEAQAIYAGESTTPLMENVVASYVTKSDNGLLQFAVKTTEGTYNSSVFCRTAVTTTEPDLDSVLNDAAGENAAAGAGTTVQARTAFLNVLASQYKMGLGKYTNPGLILVPQEIGPDNNKQTVYLSTGRYYSEWYQADWGENTPWCACYVSWALNEVQEQLVHVHPDSDQLYDHPANGNPAGNADSKFNRSRIETDNNGVSTGQIQYYWFANVDDFMEYLKSGSNGNTWQNSAAKGGSTTPLPGDLIFFDWTGGDNPAHVGVVLRTTADLVYTIEGNSADTVAVRQYSLSDPRIIGYGVLNWKTDTTPTTE